MYNRESMLKKEIEIEVCLKDFIVDFFEKNNLKIIFPNPLLRCDVIDVLDKFCTVVYFPIEDENNKGFHIKKMPFASGKKNDYVFINTAKTMAEQVFTAAHELGHILKVDDYVISKLRIEDNKPTREWIISRFAAVLLMPEEIFWASFELEINKYQQEDKSISVSDIFKVVVNLMNQFFVPYKAVVRRIHELGALLDEDYRFLLGKGDITEEKIQETIQELIKKYGFSRLQDTEKRKWIEGLPELLDSAEEKGVVSSEKIQYIRTLFEIQPIKLFNEIEDTFFLNTQEGKKNNENR